MRRVYDDRKLMHSPRGTGSAARAAALLALTLGGCAVASAPLQNTPQIVATPAPGQLTVSSQPSHPIGDVLPIYVSIANGTDAPRLVVPSQVFALDDAGSRVAPLPPAEAAREAGGAGELKAALTSAAASGAMGGILGAGLGAIAGSLIRGAGTGAALGGAIGAGEGAIQGAPLGQAKADQQANIQMSALALPAQDVRHDFTVSGYVFFPKGDYKQIQLLLVDSETGNTEVISQQLK
ncbi:MAG TPA: hypothetical protein VND20_10025 [Candidatus Binataceae bacterium]|nr:hypothetical protein [Candidatus Binataceae bacterium]